MARLGVVILICIISCFCGIFCKSNIPKIAIVGGGIGGTSSAYFLRELFGAETNIDLYEPKTIGGRLATVAIEDGFYETGGAIIHPRNKYMIDFLKKFGQTKRTNAVFSQFGIYDGREFRYLQSAWDVISFLKLVWRYGYGPVKLQAFIDDHLRHFSRIYVLQDNQQCYRTVGELLEAMSPLLEQGMSKTTHTGFSNSGFSDILIEELIAATLSANYGQNTSVHELVGLVSVAGASSGLWAVQGGNKRIPEELLSHSRATYIKSEVSRINFNPQTQDYTLEMLGERFGPGNKSTYDIVIIAAPLTEDLSKIRFMNLPQNVSFPGAYQRTVCTIVDGTVDFSYFGFEDESEMMDEVLFVNFDSFFHSLGRINSVNEKDSKSKSNVWKLFSHLPIDDNDLKKVFMEITSVKRVDWLAYPRYDTLKRSDSFVLHKQLYHVNAIEWAASAMEMSVIGAKNVALLAYKTWNNLDYVDPNKRFGDEL